MIGDGWTFWEYLFFGFAAFFAALLYIALEYWLQIFLLLLIFAAIKFTVRALK